MLAIVLAGALGACRVFKVPMHFGWDEGVQVFIGCALHATLWTMWRERRRVQKKPVTLEVP